MSQDKRRKRGMERIAGRKIKMKLKSFKKLKERKGKGYADTCSLHCTWN
jgi:hypothetical protein